MKNPCSAVRWVALLGLAALILSVPALAQPGGSRFVAELIWGTNGDKPPGKDIKPVVPELDKALHRVFKWQRYYRIEQKEFTVAGAQPTRVEMSKDCRLEVTRLTEEEYEIQLFGKGVLVVTKRQRVLPGETIVLGGDDKNDNAWFVVLALSKGRPAKP